MLEMYSILYFSSLVMSVILYVSANASNSSTFTEQFKCEYDECSFKKRPEAEK